MTHFNPIPSILTPKTDGRYVARGEGPATVPSGRFRIRQPTLAEASGSGGVAPIPAVRGTTMEPPESTHSGPPGATSISFARCEGFQTRDAGETQPETDQE